MYIITILIFQLTAFSGQMMPFSAVILLHMIFCPATELVSTIMHHSSALLPPPPLRLEHNLCTYTLPHSQVLSSSSLLFPQTRHFLRAPKMALHITLRIMSDIAVRYPEYSIYIQIIYLRPLQGFPLQVFYHCFNDKGCSVHDSVSICEDS